MCPGDFFLACASGRRLGGLPFGRSHGKILSLTGWRCFAIQNSTVWAINSAGECYLHTVEVTGSIPVSPTMKKPQGRTPLRPFSYCAGAIRLPVRFYRGSCFRFGVEHWGRRTGRQGRAFMNRVLCSLHFISKIGRVSPEGPDMIAQTGKLL
jgi:hypothetical protein